MTTDPIILPVAHDPYAHRWYDRPFTWGGSPQETLTFDAPAGAETVRVQFAILSQFANQSLDVFTVLDGELHALVAVSRESGGSSNANVIAIEPLPRRQIPLADWTRLVSDFTLASAARRMRALLAPMAVARLDLAPVPQTCAVLVREFGDDMDIVRSARKSYREKKKRLPADDRKLIRYLLRNRHTSPIEQVALVFGVRAPLYVVQQLLRHRTAKLNQLSGRYEEHDEDFELTEPTGWREQSTTNKQGSGETMPLEVGERMSALEAEVTAKAWAAYKEMLAAGVAREQARRVLPASTIVELVWQCDMHNLLHFLGLRLAPDAQLEIRKLAVQMAAEVARRFPWTWAAWLEMGAPKPVREMWAAQQATTASTTTPDTTEPGQ